ncbi:hypothetical protein GCM10023178_60200 [Actinomadura luteofluorescens]
MTVENRSAMGVRLPSPWNSLARVYAVIGSSPHLPYASKKPYAVTPRAWTTRSGMRSRSKWLIFSRNW